MNYIKFIYRKIHLTGSFLLLLVTLSSSVVVAADSLTTVKVAVGPALPPLYLKNPVGADSVGYYVDLFKTLGNVLGVEFELVPYSDRFGIIDAFSSSTVNSCSYVACGIQPKNATFAELPFYFYFLYGDFDPDKLILTPGTRIGVIKGFDLDSVLSQRFSGVVTVPFDCPTDAVSALDSGLIEGLIFSPYLSPRLIDLKNNFVRSRYPVFSGRVVFKFSSAMISHIPDFEEKLEEFLRSSSLSSINDRWFKTHYDRVLKSRFGAQTGFGKWIWMLCFVCVGLFAIFRYCGQGVFLTQHGAVRQELEQMRSFVDLASILIVALDSDGNVAFINQAGCSTIGFDKEYIEGKNWLETFVHPTHRKAARKIFESLKKQGCTKGRKHRGYLLNSKGSKRLIAYVSTPLFDNDGKCVGTFCSGEDITNTVNAQQEAIKQQERLMQAGKMVSLGVLSSGIAHEINNPNNFIMLNAPIILDVWKSSVLILDEYYEDNGEFLLGGLPYSMVRQKVTTLCSGILDGSRRIQRIVNDLKDFARKDTIGYDDDVDINEVIKSSITLTFSMIKKSTVNFDVSYGELLPAVKGNFQKLEQVVINLIQNSCYALEDKSQGIFIKTFVRDNSVVIKVKDEGKGIPKKLIKQIGEPFFTTRRSSGGTGLGLSISINIVKKLSGRITFDSVLGKGTQVTIILPAIKTVSI